MALGRKVVHLVRLHLLNDPYKIGCVCQIPIVKNHFSMVFMGVLVKVVDAGSVKQRGPSLDAVDLISLFQ